MWVQVLAEEDEGNPFPAAQVVHRVVCLQSWRYIGLTILTPDSTAKSEIYQVDTTDILFILSGAFVGLDKVVQQRLAKGVRQRASISPVLSGLVYISATVDRVWSTTRR